MPITNLTTLFTILFLFGGSFWVGKQYLREKNTILGYFTIFLFGIGLASTFWGLGIILVDHQPYLASLTYPLGILCGGIGIIFFTKVGLRFTLPKYEKPIFGLSLLGLFVFCLFLTSQLPVLEKTSDGIVSWNVPLIPALAVITVGALFSLVNTWLFVIEGSKVKNTVLKIRAILISGSFMIYMIGGLAHNAFREETPLIISDLLTCFGAALLLLAIYLPRIWKHNVK